MGDETTVTPAHAQRGTVHFVAQYPPHEPREHDHHYKYFHEARERLRRLGKLVCWRCGSRENIQVHHAVVEQALINGVDLERFIDLYPEFHLVHGDEEAFLQWCESEGNFLVLCANCHIGKEAIHLLPYPLWLAGRFWRADLPRPATVVTGAGAAHPAESTG